MIHRSGADSAPGSGSGSSADAMGCQVRPIPAGCGTETYFRRQFVAESTVLTELNAILSCMQSALSSGLLGLMC